MRLKPRLVDGYVLREMVGPFLVGLVVYSFLFLITLLINICARFMVWRIAGSQRPGGLLL